MHLTKMWTEKSPELIGFRKHHQLVVKYNSRQRVFDIIYLASQVTDVTAPPRPGKRAPLIWNLNAKSKVLTEQVQSLWVAPRRPRHSAMK